VRIGAVIRDDGSGARGRAGLSINRSPGQRRNAAAAHGARGHLFSVSMNWGADVCCEGARGARILAVSGFDGRQCVGSL